MTKCIGAFLRFCFASLVTSEQFPLAKGSLTSCYCLITESNCFLWRNRNVCKNGDGPSTTTPWFVPPSRTTFISNRKKSLAGRISLNEKFGEIDRPNLAPNESDTTRVRIWNALVAANGEEVSLKQLGAMVGERNMGDLRSHLKHVEKQAKTFGNKSDVWKQRRGLVAECGSDTNRSPIQKLKLKIRKGERGMTFIRLQI